jgi:hypothetical protein
MLQVQLASTLCVDGRWQSSCCIETFLPSFFLSETVDDRGRMRPRRPGHGRGIAIRGEQ